MSDFEKPTERVGVNLDRNVPFESGVSYNKEHYYRMIGERGYNDFLDTGLIRMKPESKQEYNHTYFFKGAPMNRYADARARVQYFVEVKADDDLFIVEDAGYPRSTRPLSSADQIRIYRYSVSDGAEVVFDSFGNRDFLCVS